MPSLQTGKEYLVSFGIEVNPGEISCHHKSAFG